MATIKDLANRTSFSVATISRVLNNDPAMKVTAHTRMVILEAAAELNYTSSKPKKSQKNPVMHIAVAEMMTREEQVSDPYYLYLKNYVVRECMEQGYMVSYLSDLDKNFWRSDKKTLDGILAIGIFSEEQIEQMTKISENIVFVDSSPDEQRFDSVVLNFELGIKSALDYLRKHGHKRIGFLGPTYKLDQRKHPAPEVRCQYFKKYMSELGCYEEEWMIDTQYTPEENREQVKKWLQSEKQRPSAFLAYNEGTAITAVSVFKEQGIRIPEDISIVSFNDTPLSILIEPPLTSINVHMESMGREAVRLLTERIRQPKYLPHKIVLPLTLTERSSVIEYGS